VGRAAALFPIHLRHRPGQGLGTPQHPAWKDKEPFASLLKGDLKAALAGGEPAIAEIVTTTHSGMTTGEFDAIVKDWLASARHPKTQQPYTKMVYQPMLELLAFLRSNGFKTFIVTGGGIEFVRAFAEDTYGIPPEQVVGSSGKTKFQIRDGIPMLINLRSISSTTRQASPSPSSCTSAAGRSRSAFLPLPPPHRCQTRMGL
jgi:hypothetical protein